MYMCRDTLELRTQGVPEVLLAEHHRQVHATVEKLCKVHRYLIADDIREDLAEEIIYGLAKNDYQGLRTFANRSSFTTWLDRIALYHMRAYLRKQGRTVPLQVDSIELIPKLVCRPAQEERLIRRERLKLLKRAIGSLTENDKAYLHYCFLEELDAAEVSRRMGRPIEYVYKRKSELLKKLRHLINTPPTQEDFPPSPL